MTVLHVYLNMKSTIIQPAGLLYFEGNTVYKDWACRYWDMSFYFRICTYKMEPGWGTGWMTGDPGFNFQQKQGLCLLSIIQIDPGIHSASYIIDIKGPLLRGKKVNGGEK
jgi:hypothetical protein